MKFFKGIISLLVLFQLLFSQVFYPGYKQTEEKLNDTQWIRRGYFSLFFPHEKKCKIDKASLRVYLDDKREDTDTIETLFGTLIKGERHDIDLQQEGKDYELIEEEDEYIIKFTKYIPREAFLAVAFKFEEGGKIKEVGYKGSEVDYSNLKIIKGKRGETTELRRFYQLNHREILPPEKDPDFSLIIEDRHKIKYDVSDFPYTLNCKEGVIEFEREFDNPTYRSARLEWKYKILVKYKYKIVSRGLSPTGVIPDLEFKEIHSTLSITGSQTVRVGYTHDFLQKYKGYNLELTPHPTTSQPFEFDQVLQVRATGEIEKKIAVDIDHRGGKGVSEPTRISVRYIGEREEFVKNVHFGDITFPAPEHVSLASKAFGIRLDGETHGFKISGAASQTKGSPRVIPLEGGYAAEEEVIPDTDYIEHYYYSLWTEEERKRYLARGSFPNIKKETVRLFLDDRRASNDGDAEHPNTFKVKIGDEEFAFDELVRGVDYSLELNRKGFDRGIIEFFKRIEPEYVLCVAFVHSEGEVGFVEKSDKPWDKGKARWVGNFEKIKWLKNGPKDRGADAWGTMLTTVYGLKYRNILPFKANEDSLVIRERKTRRDVSKERNYHLYFTEGLVIFEEPFQTRKDYEKTLPEARYEIIVKYHYKKARFALGASYGRRVGAYDLETIGLVEGSERVYIGNRLLKYNPDPNSLKSGEYSIDRDGTLYLYEGDITKGEEIRVEFQESPLGLGGGDILLGVKSEFDLPAFLEAQGRAFKVLKEFKIGGIGVYNKRAAPTAGEIPSIFTPPTSQGIVETNARVKLEWELNNKREKEELSEEDNEKYKEEVEEKIYFKEEKWEDEQISSEELKPKRGFPLTFECHGSVARSGYNVNNASLTLGEGRERVTIKGPASIDNMEAIDISLNCPLAAGQWMLSSPPQGELQEARGTITRVFNRQGEGAERTRELKPLLEVEFSLNPGEWCGIITFLPYSDISPYKDFEVSVHSPRLDGLLDMYFDIGDISEDADGDSILDTEDKNRNYILDKEPNEDIGLDGVKGEDEKKTAGDGARSNRLTNPGWLAWDDDFSPPKKLMGTEGNNEIDTEDLNGDGRLNTSNNYLEYHFKLGEDAGWEYFSLPISLPFKKVGVGRVDLKNIKFVRIWLKNNSRERLGGMLTFEFIRFTGNRWVVNDKVERWLEEGVFEVGYVNKTTNPEYEERRKYLKDKDKGKVYLTEKRREQALCLRYIDIPKGLKKEEAAWCRLSLGSVGVDLTHYRKLQFALYATPENEDVELFLWLGRGISDLVECRVKLTGYGWQEVTLSLDELRRALSKYRQEPGTKNTWKPLTGDFFKKEENDLPTENLSLWVIGEPYLTNITDFYFGIKGIQGKGEIWINDLLVFQPSLFTGTQERLYTKIGIGDGIFSADFSHTKHTSAFTKADQELPRGERDIRQENTFTISSYKYPILPQISYSKITTEKDIETISRFDALKEAKREEYPFRLSWNPSTFTLIRGAEDKKILTLKPNSRFEYTKRTIDYALTSQKEDREDERRFTQNSLLFSLLLPEKLWYLFPNQELDLNYSWGLEQVNYRKEYKKAYINKEGRLPYGGWKDAPILTDSGSISWQGESRPFKWLKISPNLGYELSREQDGNKKPRPEKLEFTQERQRAGITLGQTFREGFLQSSSLSYKLTSSHQLKTLNYNFNNSLSSSCSLNLTALKDFLLGLSQEETTKEAEPTTEEDWQWYQRGYPSRPRKGSDFEIMPSLTFSSGVSYQYGEVDIYGQVKEKYPFKIPPLRERLPIGLRLDFSQAFKRSNYQTKFELGTSEIQIKNTSFRPHYTFIRNEEFSEKLLFLSTKHTLFGDIEIESLFLRQLLRSRGWQLQRFIIRGDITYYTTGRWDISEENGKLSRSISDKSTEWNLGAYLRIPSLRKKNTRCTLTLFDTNYTFTQRWGGYSAHELREKLVQFEVNWDRVKVSRKISLFGWKKFEIDQEFDIGGRINLINFENRSTSSPSGRKKTVEWFNLTVDFTYDVMQNIKLTFGSKTNWFTDLLVAGRDTFNVGIFLETRILF